MNKAVDKLESVKAAFAHWLETRAIRGKIPDHLCSHSKSKHSPHYLAGASVMWDRDILLV